MVACCVGVWTYNNIFIYYSRVVCWLIKLLPEAACRRQRVTAKSCKYPPITSHEPPERCLRFSHFKRAINFYLRIVNDAKCIAIKLIGIFKCRLKNLWCFFNNECLRLDSEIILFQGGEKPYKMGKFQNLETSPTILVAVGLSEKINEYSKKVEVIL